MRDVVRSGLVLLVITAVAGLGLGFVNGITKDRIASQSLGAIADSLGVVLPEADSFAEVETAEGYTNINAVYEGKAGSSVAGYVVNIGAQGYAGIVETLVAIDTNGVITGVEVVNHTETPGLGSKATEPEFLSQYVGRSKSQKVVKAEPGNDEILAVASATITSSTVTLCVNDALNYYYDNLGDPSMRPEGDTSGASSGDPMSNALPTADSFEEISPAGGYEGISAVHRGLSQGSAVGYVISAGSQGFGGIVECLVGIGNDGAVTGVVVTNHSETPGLGSLIEEPEFLANYVGKTAGQYVVTEAPGNDEIQAISGATVSTVAVTVCVNDSLGYFEDNLKGSISESGGAAKNEFVEVSEEALSAVLPEAEGFEALDIAGGFDGISSVYKGTTPDGIAGYVVGIGSQGFAGAVETLVALDADGAVAGVSIQSHTETEGLGSKIEEKEFLANFVGKSASQYVVTEAPGNDEIQAISGATISTVAVAVCVNDALGYFGENLSGAVSGDVSEESSGSGFVEVSEEALSAVLPEAAGFEAMDISSGYEGISSVYKGTTPNGASGYVLGIGSQGFAGVVETLVALDAGGTVTGVSIQSHTETDGLGSKIEEAEFLANFIGKSNSQYVVTEAPGDDEIQAISGATISTVAVAVCVNDALGYFDENLKDADAESDESAEESEEAAEEVDETAGETAEVSEEDLSAVLPDAEEFEAMDAADGYDGISVIYRGIGSDETVGYVVGIGAEGFAGVVETLVAMDTDGVITGVGIQSHTETDGLGSKIEEPEFLESFTGKSNSQYVVTEAPGDDEIQAISGATISTVAVAVCVNDALGYFDENLKDADDGSDEAAEESEEAAEEVDETAGETAEVSEEDLSAVLPDAEEFETMDVADGYDGISVIYRGIGSDETVGYVVGIGAEGFAGVVETLVAMDTDGVITGVGIQSHTETDGLGSKIEEAEFLANFIGKSNSQYVVTEAPGDDEIQAISGATISTVAVAVCVNDALGYFDENLKDADNGSDESAEESEEVDEAAEEVDETAGETAEVSEEDLSAVLPDAEEFETMDVADGYDGISVIYRGIGSDETVGYVVGIGAEGFAGVVETLVAMDTDGVITGVGIQSHTETDGLGSKIEEPEFLESFIGKSNSQYVVTEVPGDDEIQAISGATISTVAVAVCVNDALGYFDENLKDADDGSDEAAEESEEASEEVDETAEEVDETAGETAEVSEEALSAVLPDAEEFEEMDAADGYDGISVIYRGIGSDETVGYVVGIGAEGFAGVVETLVAMDTDGVITGVGIQSHTETDGLGSKIEEPEFLESFIGKSNSQYVVTEAPGDDEIQAISGATISTVAVAVCVNDALGYFDENLKEAE